MTNHIEYGLKNVLFVVSSSGNGRSLNQKKKLFDPVNSRKEHTLVNGSIF